MGKVAATFMREAFDNLHCVYYIKSSGVAISATLYNYKDLMLHRPHEPFSVLALFDMKGWMDVLLKVQSWTTSTINLVDITEYVIIRMITSIAELRVFKYTYLNCES